jgi:ssRNA-specific RNase YbeY (16S rRNA maturation enzyme)
VLSYPQVINDAVRDEMLVDDKVDELVEHGLMHLLGLHHE